MKKRPKFSSESCSDDCVVLCCPKCNGDYVSSYFANAYFRESEDSPTGTRVEAFLGDVKVKTSMEGNPSPRRDGFSIGFVCEECGYKDFCLHILQHKGRTFLSVD